MHCVNVKNVLIENACVRASFFIYLVNVIKPNGMGNPSRRPRGKETFLVNKT